MNDAERLRLLAEAQEAAREARAREREQHATPPARAPYADVPERAFGGDTYEPEIDGKPLRGQLKAVWDAMTDGEWWTLSQLAGRTGGSEAAVSARIRDLRKHRFGRHTVEAERVEGTKGRLWHYRLTTNPLGREP